MIVGWLRRMFGQEPPEEDHNDELEERVHKYEERNAKAVAEADKAIDRELRVAHEAIVGRRVRNTGHAPDRRAHH